jgi:hypothetical protein
MSSTISGPHSTSSNRAGTNGWAPSSVIILHDATRRTSVRFNPLEPSRVPGATWRVRARVYGERPLEPLWEHESGPFQWGEQYELDSAMLASELGLDTLHHYAEFHPYTLDLAPTHEQIVAPLFAHYTARDGSFAAHLPSSYIYGSARAYKLGTGAKYQSFPCVELGGDFEAEVYTINHNLRKVTYSVLTVPDGAAVREYGPFTVRPKSFDVWRSDVGGSTGSPVPTGIIIKSDVRLASFVGTFSRPLGRLVGLDHTHPFFPR